MLNVYDIALNCRIYGPELRTVIWFQGCSIQCKGCINPHLWSFDCKELISVNSLVDKIPNNDVTLLGGEPLDQEGILDFVKELKRKEIGIILFTGYSIRELQGSRLECTKLCDVVISEPFEIDQLNPKLYLRGSDNQVITFNSDRYNPSDFEQSESIEVIIGNQVEIHGRNDDKFLWELLKKSDAKQSK